MASGFGPGRSSRGGGRNLRSQSSKFPFEAGGGWWWWAEGSRAFGQRKRGGKRLFLLAFGYGREQQSIYVSKNLHFSSIKFSFQSLGHLRCVRAGGARGSGPPWAWHPVLPLRDFGKRNLPGVHWVLTKSCLSACRRSTDNNLGTFFYSLFKLRLVCLNQKQNSQVKRILFAHSAPVVKGMSLDFI